MLGLAYANLSVRDLKDSNPTIPRRQCSVLCKKGANLFSDLMWLALGRKRLGRDK